MDIKSVKEDLRNAQKHPYRNMDAIRTSLVKEDELIAKRTELVDSVNDLRTTVADHARAEENILDTMKKVFEKK